MDLNVLKTPKKVHKYVLIFIDKKNVGNNSSTINYIKIYDIA